MFGCSDVRVLGFSFGPPKPQAGYWRPTPGAKVRGHGEQPPGLPIRRISGRLAGLGFRAGGLGFRA